VAKPNIVYIMADDMGYGDLGCYGATKIPTPNIDRVADEGIRFTDAHSSSAVCTPSRYSVLTGQYCWRTVRKRGVGGGFSLPLIDSSRMTVASLLKQNGYATAAVGKWHVGLEWQLKDTVPEASKKSQDQRLEHRISTSTDGAGNAFDPELWEDSGVIDYHKPILGGPTSKGFDYFFGIAGSLDMPPYCFIENDRTVGIPDVEKSPYNPQQKKGYMTSGWRDDEVDINFAKKAVDFIDSHCESQPDMPFFLYVTPSAPHRPCVAPDFLKSKSQAGPRGDMVMVVDWVVGQILDTLDRHNLADDTLVIVTSDNGARPADVDGDTYGHKSCGDLRGYKADIWDGGHREPFIARWPKAIKAGMVSNETVCLIDFTATCAAIVGANLPDHAAEDSFNLLPALIAQQPKKPIREALVHHSVDGMFSVRRGNWKLILGQGSGGFSEPSRVVPGPGEPLGQLYDMDNDIAETTNLWNKHPDIVASLTAILQRYREQGHSRPFIAEADPSRYL
jgi:arylsulfatase A